LTNYSKKWGVVMNEQETKAIKWIKNVRDDAVVTLDHIAKNEPNVSPMLYAGRKEKAEVIIAGFKELDQYRALGTVKELQEVRGKQIPKKLVGWDLCTCPRCGTYNETVKKRRNTVNQDTVYCWHCGQAMEITRLE
jgi:hypothetical protein